MPPKPLPYHPKQGEVLRCDYSGLVPPEMDKVRWVVCVSPKFVNRPNLCTVVPLSTTPPEVAQNYHVLLDKDPYPEGGGLPVWAKCDMVMTVSFAKLAEDMDHGMGELAAAIRAG
jgi:mRNA interferase MazF